AEVAFSFAVAVRVCGRTDKDLDAQGLANLGVERSVQEQDAVLKFGAIERGEVEQIVGTGVGVVEVVAGAQSVVRSEVDALSAVVEDAVAEDGVAAAGEGDLADARVAADEDAVLAAVGDEVAGAGRGAADHVASGLVGDEDAVADVAARRDAIG